MLQKVLLFLPSCYKLVSTEVKTNVAVFHHFQDQTQDSYAF